MDRSRPVTTGLAVLAVGFAVAACDDDPTPVTFDVTVENVSTPGTVNTDRANGTVPLSPPVFAVHTGANPMFAVGATADAGTELIAEDGFPTEEVPDLEGRDNVLAVEAVPSPGGTPDVPALFPGESSTFTVTVRREDAILNLETMFVQSNDWFYTLGESGVALFDDGEPVDGDITAEVALYDAGTEEDTPPGTGDFQKPVQDPEASDVGPAESFPVRLAADRHPDFEIPESSAVILVTITPRQQ